MLAFFVLGAMATTVATLPFVLVAIPFLAWYFASARRVFVISSRELKRIEGLARSPIFAMLGESLNGIATIRPNSAVDFFKEKFRLAHDAHTRSFFSFIASSRWVGFRMDTLLFVFVAIVSFLSVLVHEKKFIQIDPAVLGLSLSVLLQLAGLFQWCVRQSAEVVNQMVSVERVLAFRNLRSEAELVNESDRKLLATGWPQNGSIVVADLSVRYRPSLPLALDGVSFSIPGGSRVGIVGRTGSGYVDGYLSLRLRTITHIIVQSKSTVVQSLFRLIEAESGSITIDGVNIAAVGLHALRTNLSVIPQVPTLFSGCSVRDNLDLFGSHDAASLRQVIDACHLGKVIDDLPEGIDSQVAEGGSNFSVGQRQLLCLARAILSKTRILVLDEATASVDRRTDQLLQTALKENFRDGTILAVAHRLDTIIDFDLCLVLGAGKVLEFGSPAELLRRQGGAFASMVQDTGPSMAAELRRIAFETEKASRSISI
jgi:ATP-binding cassette, subfamily C (CFTR/MRP), member 4